MVKKIKLPLSREELYKMEERNFLLQAQRTQQHKVVAKQEGNKKKPLKQKERES